MEKVIQVPMSDDQALELSDLARARGISRAELIRAACRQYVVLLRQAELERAYVRGYQEMPESPDFGSVSATLMASILPAEDWSS